MKILCAVVALVAFFGVSEAVVCKNNTDCGTGECCYFEPEFMVVSKRQLTLPKMNNHKYDTGVCEKYLLRDDMCDVFAVMNGHCGCTSGLQCRWVPDPTTPAPNGKRGMVPHNEPGSYKCAPGH